MKKTLAAITTLVMAGLPIIGRLIIYSTETITEYPAFLLVDWLFFSIAVNLALVTLLANESRIIDYQKRTLIGSYILTFMTAFTLALGMILPELPNKANMTTLNIMGICIVFATSLLYIVVISKSKDIGNV